jgi:hypothetical protein
MTLTLPSIDVLRDELGSLQDLSMADIARRRQWVWRRMLEVAKESERVDGELSQLRVARDRARTEAEEASYAMFPDRRVAHHKAVADLAAADLTSRVAGLESEARILNRWHRTLDTLHHGLQSHSADMRGLGG